jgi:hypothetical protein
VIVNDVLIVRLRVMIGAVYTSRRVCPERGRFTTLRVGAAVYIYFAVAAQSLKSEEASHHPERPSAAMDVAVVTARAMRMWWSACRTRVSKTKTD